MLAFLHPPGDLVQNGGSIAGDLQLGNFENRCAHSRPYKPAAVADASRSLRPDSNV